MEAIQVEIGRELIKYVIEANARPSFDLVNQIQLLREDLLVRLNFHVPPVRICDNSNLLPRQLRIYIYEKVAIDEQLNELQGSTELSNILAEQIRCFAQDSCPFAYQVAPFTNKHQS